MNTMIRWFFYIWLLAIDSLEQICDFANVFKPVFQGGIRPRQNRLVPY